MAIALPAATEKALLIIYFFCFALDSPPGGFSRFGDSPSGSFCPAGHSFTCGFPGFANCFSGSSASRTNRVCTIGYAVLNFVTNALDVFSGFFFASGPGSLVILRQCAGR
jgi:hypothetical protein